MWFEIQRWLYATDEYRYVEKTKTDAHGDCVHHNYPFFTGNPVLSTDVGVQTLHKLLLHQNVAVETVKFHTEAVHCSQEILSSRACSSKRNLTAIMIAIDTSTFMLAQTCETWSISHFFSQWSQIPSSGILSSSHNAAQAPRCLRIQTFHKETDLIYGLFFDTSFWLI